MKTFRELLNGGDLRSIGKSNEVVTLITDQESFDNLFSFLFSNKRIVVMRAADVIEKITATSPKYLNKHKKKIFVLSETVTNKELKWHLALLLPRLQLNEKETGIVIEKLTIWALDKKESRIVRVNSMQGLFDLSRENPALQNNFDQTIRALEQENIRSITARIKKFKKSSK